MPAWNQGAARSSPSSARPVRLSDLSGGGGGGVGPAGQEPELLELIWEILFDFVSCSVELCDNLQLRRRLPRSSGSSAARDAHLLESMSICFVGILLQSDSVTASLTYPPESGRRTGDAGLGVTRGRLSSVRSLLVRPIASLLISGGFSAILL